MDIILYDGVCGLCNRVVRFFLKRDRERVFRFASLQSPFAREVLARHGLRAEPLETFYAVQGFGTAGERVIARSEAALYAVARLGGGWKTIAGGLRFLPRGILNFLYDIVARYRYAVFGKYETCPMPDPRDRDRFVD